MGIANSHELVPHNSGLWRSWIDQVAISALVQSGSIVVLCHRLPHVAWFSWVISNSRSLIRLVAALALK